MERSIENIWKEGFLKGDALVAPKINDLYNQKSIHIIDKLKRMFKINLIAIVAFSILFLIVSIFIGIPIMGGLFMAALMVMVLINKRLLNDLEKIDKGVNSYQYLKAVNQWVAKQVTINKKMSRFLYPIFFLSFILGFWFQNAEGTFLGERIVGEFLIRFPNMYLIYGVPLIGIVIVVLVMGLLAVVGGRIYRWDLNLVYGRVFKKMNELLTDLESLRS